MNTQQLILEAKKALVEINANIEICSPNEFGKYPFGTDILGIWLALKSEYEAELFDLNKANGAYEVKNVPASAYKEQPKIKSRSYYSEC